MNELSLELEMKPIPKLFVYGNQDNFIGVKNLKKFADSIGIDEENFDVYDKTMNVTQNGK